MVKIGDRIKTENGFEGIVTYIDKSDDGRYILFYKENVLSPHYFLLEGDEDFEVVEDE